MRASWLLSPLPQSSQWTLEARQCLERELEKTWVYPFLRLRAIALALRVLRLRAIALALRVLRLRAIALALRRLMPPEFVNPRPSAVATLFRRSAAKTSMHNHPIRTFKNDCTVS